MIALNRAWIASSASPHVIRSKRPSPRAPTRRSGVRRRPAPWTNAGYACGTFAQSTPPVYGLACEPRIPTIRSSSTVTVRLHVSGQSSGQTLGRSTLTPAIVLESAVTEEGGRARAAPGDPRGRGGVDGAGTVGGRDARRLWRRSHQGGAARGRLQPKDARAAHAAAVGGALLLPGGQPLEAVHRAGSKVNRRRRDPPQAREHHRRVPDQLPRAGARAAQAPLGRPRPPQPAPRLRERLGVRRVGARGGQAWLRHGRLLGALGARVEPLDAGGHPGPARGGRGRSPDRARALRRRCARPLRARAYRPWAEGRHLAPRRRGLGKLLEHPGPALRRDVPAQAPARAGARLRLGLLQDARRPHAQIRPREPGAALARLRSR